MRLRNVDVPWQVSPSSAWLELTIAEEQKPVLRIRAIFRPPEGPVLRRVRISFESEGPARFGSRRDPGARNEDFDWSQIPGARLAGEPMEVTLERARIYMEETRCAALPGMYVVDGSTWPSTAGVEQSGFLHYIVFGRDNRCEVLATGFEWKVED